MQTNKYRVTAEQHNLLVSFEPQAQWNSTTSVLRRSSRRRNNEYDLEASISLAAYYSYVSRICSYWVIGQNIAYTNFGNSLVLTIASTTAFQRIAAKITFDKFVWEAFPRSGLVPCSARLLRLTDGFKICWVDAMVIAMSVTASNLRNILRNSHIAVHQQNNNYM